MPDTMAVLCTNPNHQAQVGQYRHMLLLSVQVRVFPSVPRQTGSQSPVQLLVLRFTTEEVPAVLILFILVHLPFHRRQLYTHMRQEADIDRAILFPKRVHIQLRSALRHLFPRAEMLSHSPVLHPERQSIIPVVAYLVHVLLVALSQSNPPAR